MDNYITQVLSGITDVAQKADYRITLIPFDPYGRDEDEFVKWAHSKILDGLILIKTITNDKRIHKLADSGFPFLLVNHKTTDQRVSFVDSRNITGARTAVAYLSRRGHRQIACVAGNLEESNAQDRLRGFKEAMAENELELKDEWIIPGWFDQQAAYIESQRLFRGANRPSAVFCADDYMAIGVMRRIHEMGLRIPQDVAVIGFDDIEPAAYINPALTTIRQPLPEMGRQSAALLLDRIEGRHMEPVQKFLDVELVERDSC
jgi:DNA-binding LacI/PurR family transcriptional regulator